MSEEGEKEKIRKQRDDKGERTKEIEEGERGEGSGKWVFGVSSLSFPIYHLINTYLVSSSPSLSQHYSRRS